MALEDYRHDMEICSRCSMCKFVPMDQIKSQTYANVCPSIARYNFHSYSGGGKLNFALGLLENRVDYTDDMIDRVYRCVMCGACDVSCKVNRDMEVLQPLYELRSRCVEAGQSLPAHMAVIDGLKKEDNMMQAKKADRGQWSEGLDVKAVTRDRAEVYYHAGCRYSFDKELWPVARGAVNLLKRAGVDVGIAGKDETCCGGRAYEMGYRGELVKYAENNIEMLKTAGIKTVVTSCADCFHTFSVLYDMLGVKGDLEVLHITEYIDRLMKMGTLRPTTEIPMVVTYHDPCHLGRMGEPWVEWKGRRIVEDTKPILYDPPKQFRRGMNGVYDPPRNILRSIPGLKFVEMERIREYAWCCGAGGGVVDGYPDFSLWTAEKRIDEAMDTGAEAIVTACPWCKSMFEDVLKERGEGFRVYDIVELVEQGSTTY
jgi:Fe-S oxidoreductase